MQTAPSAGYGMTVRLIPSVFDKRVVEAVAGGVDVMAPGASLDAVGQ